MSHETGTGQLLCHVADRVAVVTLNRPEARNALTMEMKQALAALVPALGADPEVGAVLLTGAGGAFCSGGDTKMMARDGAPPSPEDRKRQLRWEHGIPRGLHRLEKPTLAALPGPAAGAGLGLALACDLRLMAADAFVTTSYVKLGLSGDYGTSWFLTHLVGTAKARELLFTGARVGADECERLGLANRVVPGDELEKAAFELARGVANGPPIALRHMKGNLNRALEVTLETALDAEAEHMVAGAGTEGLPGGGGPPSTRSARRSSGDVRRDGGSDDGGSGRGPARLGRAGGDHQLRPARAAQRGRRRDGIVGSSRSWRELAGSDRVRAVVWRGEGKIFSSGRDTSQLGVRSEDISDFDFIERGHAGTQGFFSLPVPSIAALKGWVIGGSFERALLCDMRIAGESARMRLPEIVHGVVPDSGGTARLFQMAGHGLAADLALTGRVMDAEEALRHGVVSRVVPDAELDEAVLEAARQIAAAPPFTVKMFLRTFRTAGEPAGPVLAPGGERGPEHGLRLRGLRRVQGGARRGARADVPESLGARGRARRGPARLLVPRGHGGRGGRRRGFGPTGSRKDEAFDAEIASRFGELPGRAASGELGRVARNPARDVGPGDRARPAPAEPSSRLARRPSASTSGPERSRSRPSDAGAGRCAASAGSRLPLPAPGARRGPGAPGALCGALPGPGVAGDTRPGGPASTEYRLRGAAPGRHRPASGAFRTANAVLGRTPTAEGGGLPGGGGDAF